MFTPSFWSKDTPEISSKHTTSSGEDNCSLTTPRLSSRAAGVRSGVSVWRVICWTPATARIDWPSPVAVAVSCVFFRHSRSFDPIAQNKTRDEVDSGFIPGVIVSMSLQPAIPRRVGLHQNPPPLHQPISMLNPPAETVNHHLVRAGEFSTGTMGIFAPALTPARPTGDFHFLFGHRRARRCQWGSQPAPQQRQMS
jgi:hypothetical protein